MFLLVTSNYIGWTVFSEILFLFFVAHNTKDIWPLIIHPIIPVGSFTQLNSLFLLQSSFREKKHHWDFSKKNMKNSINIPSSVADIPSFIETHWEAPKPRPGLQHWRAILSRSKGSLVSSNVAPATATASVVSNKSFALAYKGANHGENDDFSTENGDSTGENDDFIRENNDFTGENGDFTREHDDFMKEHGGAMVS